MSSTNEGMETPPRRNRKEGICTASPFTRKERTRCLFCGGDQCKRCSPTAYLLLDKPAIPKLHSSWINDSILAMQRPSDIIFQSGVLDDFKKAGITAVFNLTEPGEHPYCGTGILDATGFPYSPEKLMAVGIKHFNFHWPDMTAPSIALMTEIAHIGTTELNGGGKIAVHCHAGFGRTGMAIACILIFKDQVESTQVIQFIRNRRPGSIQTSTQERFIRKFEKSFRFLMQSFPTKDSLELSASTEGGNTRHQLLQQQQRALSPPTSNNLPATAPTDMTSITATTSAAAAVAAAPMGSDVLASDLSPLSSTTTLPVKQGGVDIFPTTSSAPKEPTTSTTTSIISTSSNNTSLYLKTLQQSAADQHYLLNTVELQSKQFLRIHKIVYFTSLAISTLSRDHVLLAHLGFTGLTKLVPKENFSSKYTNINTNNALITASNYMVATNSMTQGLEETLLTDIKLELNTNKWSRFMSVADVVAISLKLGQESVKRLTKVASILDDTASPASSALHKQHSYNNNNGSITTSTSNTNNNINASTNSPQYQVRKNSMFRTNSFKETSDADYNKSRRVSANIMTQLLLDWLETRQNCVFDVSSGRGVLALWTKHYPNFGQLGWANAAWRDMKARTRSFKAFEAELLEFLHTHLDVCRQEVLGCIVSMYGRIHRAGCALHSSSNEEEDSGAQGSAAESATVGNNLSSVQDSTKGSVRGSATRRSTAPIMDTLVALRLAIALMHARKQQHLLVRNRALNMELIKLFMLKHTDTELVIINNITFMSEHADIIMNQLGKGLINQLEAITRTLLVLQEINWSTTVGTSIGSSTSSRMSEYSMGIRDTKIRWKESSSVEQFQSI